MLESRRTVFVVLFRGVGGATQLPVKPLRLALEQAGFTSVSTYINSGNAVVSTDLPQIEVHRKVAEVARSAFGFDKEILLASVSEWRELVLANPFRHAVDQPTTLHAFLLAGMPDAEGVASLDARAAAHESIKVIGRVLYFHAPAGFGASKLPPAIDRATGVASTARNWRTVLALLSLAEAAE